MFKSNQSEEQSVSQDRLLQQLQSKLVSLQRDNVFLKQKLIQANQRFSKSFKQRAQGEESCDQKLRVQIHRLYIALDQSKQKLKSKNSQFIDLQNKYNLIRLQLDKTQALAKKLHFQLQLRTQPSLTHDQCLKREKELKKRIKVLEEKLERDMGRQKEKLERDMGRQKARVSSVSPRQRPRERKSVEYSQEYLTKLSKEMKKNMQLSKSIDGYRQKNEILSDQVKILKKIVKTRQDHTQLINQLKQQLYRNRF